MNKYVKMTISLSLIALIQSLGTPGSAAAESTWTRDIALGYNKSSGNTDKSELSISGAIKREWDNKNFGSSANIYYSESNGQMDSQEWVSLTRYAFDFTNEYKWFNSYQFEVTHDRFADIDYRLLPSVGIGYWLSRDEDWTWSVEASAGLEITKYRSSKPDDESAVMLGHTFLKKKIFDNAFIAEDLTIIPTLNNTGMRIKSETAFTNPLSDGLDLSLKYIIDHDTEPSDNKKKTDTRIITALKYSF